MTPAVQNVSIGNIPPSIETLLILFVGPGFDSNMTQYDSKRDPLLHANTRPI